jgi:hypothetical protein
MHAGQEGTKRRAHMLHVLLPKYTPMSLNYITNAFVIRNTDRQDQEHAEFSDLPVRTFS